MARMNIAVRDDLQRWAEDRIDSGTYASADELINDLLEAAREKAVKLAWLQAEIDKGDASGIDPRSVEQIFADLRAKHFSARD